MLRDPTAGVSGEKQSSDRVQVQSLVTHTVRTILAKQLNVSLF